MGENMKKWWICVVVGILSISFVNARQSKFVLIDTQHLQLDQGILDVKIHHFQELPNVSVENQLNTLIDTQSLHRVETMLEMASYKFMIDVTQSVYSLNTEYVSFSIDGMLSMADSYTKKDFYTINLNTGQVYTIEDVLGKDYVMLIKEKINQDIRKQPNLYFMEEIDKLQILPTQSFYINDKGEVVVTFDMFSIAPGYLGIPEFILPRKSF